MFGTLSGTTIHTTINVGSPRPHNSEASRPILGGFRNMKYRIIQGLRNKRKAAVLFFPVPVCFKPINSTNWCFSYK